MNPHALTLTAALAALLVSACAPEPDSRGSGIETTTATAPSEAPTDEGKARLAEKFAPMVWLADGDEHGPMDASTFIANADLWWDHGGLCKDDEPVARDVSETGLAKGEYTHPAASVPQPHSEDPLPCTHEEDATVYRSNSGDKEPQGGKGFYLDLDDGKRGGDGPGAPLQWQYHDNGDGTGAFVYWLFYGYNDYTNKHEGDWERIAVKVDGETPTGVTFWKHEEPACYMPWDRMESANGHPVTYSAKGSHGSYPWEGLFSHTGGTDATTKGKTWNTWEHTRPVTAQRWWGYRGLWGDAGPKFFSGIAGPNPDRSVAEAMTSTVCELPTLPVSFLGNWISPEPVNQPGWSSEYRVRLTLRDGKPGDTVGSTLYPELSCSGPLALVEATQDKVVVREVIASDPKLTCIKEGTITLTASGDGLTYSYVGGPSHPHVTATARLVRE